MHKPILLVDFDGVIHSYTTPWESCNRIPDPPVPGALAWLLDCQNWFLVNIYSSRSRFPEGLEAMKEWLHAQAVKEFGNVEFADDFMSGITFPLNKPSAFLTIDDRAVTFNGSFIELTPSELLQFKPWNKRAKSLEPVSD